MKFLAHLCTIVAACQLALASAAKENPLGTVLNLLDELTAKIKTDGEDEAKAYREYVEWCDDTNKNTGFAIETATGEKAKLEAKISELSSNVDAGTSKISDLAAAIQAASTEQKDAIVVREKEAADFASSEKELVSAISQLTRTISILDKEISKNPASFSQLDASSATGAIEALNTIVGAAAMPIADKNTLLALVQSDQEDEDVGAPAAATYKSHSTNIFDTLEDLKEKADGELASIRKAEVNTKHNYDMLQQSLEDQIASDTKAMEEEKAGRAAAEEEKAVAESDLDKTTKDLSTSTQQLETARSTCMQVAADHDATVSARNEELKTIAEAKKLLIDNTAGAESQTYSFIQMVTRSDLVGSEIVAEIRRVAKKEHSAALAQLASRVAAVARYGGSNGEDVFGKIKGLIRDMISKLEKQAGDEATEKAYCDEQIAKTEAKKGELEDDVAKQSSRIDRAASRSAQLNGEIKELETELAALTKDQAEMDKIRMDQKAAYTQAKADLEQGLSGVRNALEVLREYYGSASLIQEGQPSKPEIHEKSTSAGGSIINILEVVESDFATNLAKEETTESSAQSEYEAITQENAVTRTLKEQDVKYKTQEAASQDKTVADYSADREATNSELSAVLQYYTQIKDRCIAKPETYEERARRREAEIAGLKQALQIMKEETAMIQRKRSSFRGAIATA